MLLFSAQGRVGLYTNANNTDREKSALKIVWEIELPSGLSNLI